MNKLRKNDLIKARKICNTFRIIDDLNSINDRGEFESSYFNIYPKELQSGKENNDIHEASFLDFDFYFGLFDKKKTYFLFPLSECQKSQVMHHLV